MTKITKHFPHLGKLSIAILESRIKTIIGAEAIKILKEPLNEKQLKDALADALIKTEQRFIEVHSDEELCGAILDLPLADLPAVRDAVRYLYDRPADRAFALMLRKQLKEDYPLVENDRIDKAINIYLAILREELVSVDDEIRQKMIALALLGIQKTLGEITEGERLYKQFSDATLLSPQIRIREFQTLIHERTKNFVGRDYIFSAIDDLLKDPKFPSGYIVISGEPGIGKTALIAQWVKKRGYVHHFNIATQNIRSANDFLANVCAQLIVRYDLEHAALPPEATKDSGFLSRLLVEAAEKKVTQPLVILLDAFDEVDDLGLSPGENRLYLPQVLPDGVFFIVTKREEYDDHLCVDWRKDIYLKDDDPRNLEDVRRYICDFVEENRVAMAPRIEQWGISETEFVDTITERSEGNFMYLVYVLAEIRDGKLTATNVDDIRKLPRGLEDYYQRHWRAMRALDPDRFDKYYEPVVCILAVVQEPVSVDMVSEWTDLPVKRVMEVIEVWREFLNVDDAQAAEPRYRVYHTSFKDFLGKEVP